MLDRPQAVAIMTCIRARRRLGRRRMVSSKPCTSGPKRSQSKNGLLMMWAALSQESFRFALGRTASLLVKAEARRKAKRRTEGPSYAPDLASFPKAFPILLADLERGVTARHSPAASLWIISWHQLQQLPSRNCRRRSSLPDSLQRRPQKNFENSRRAYGGE
jgi:hypothetical protein